MSTTSHLLSNVYKAVILLVGLALVSCQSKPQSEMASELGTSTPPGRTPASTSLIPTHILDVTPAPEKTSFLPVITLEAVTPSPSTSSLGDLGAKGILTAKDFRSQTPIYFQYDLVGGILEPVILSDHCFLMKRGDLAFCYVEGFSLVNLTDSVLITRRIQNDQRIWLNQVETFVLYSIPGDSEGYFRWAAMDIEAGTGWNLTDEISHLLNLPELSSDGLYLIVAKTSGGLNPGFFYLFSPDNLQGDLIAFQDTYATISYAWAPGKNMLLLGATTIELEIGWCTNRLILFDAEKEESRLLLSLPELACLDDFGAQVWSPDSKKVVVVVGEKICSIVVENGEQSCLKVIGEKETLGHIVWSPDSNYLAYSIKNRTTGKQEVFIWDLDKRQQYPIPEFNLGDLGTDVELVHWQSPSP